MFEDSLVESSGRLGGGNSWAAAAFVMQILLSGTAVLISLIYTEALPKQQLMSMLEAPAPPAAAPAARTVISAKQNSHFDHNVLQIPREIPKSVAMVHDEGPPPGNAVGIAGDIPSGIPDGFTGEVVSILRSSPVRLPTGAVQKVRVSSGVAQGLLIRRIQPEYPSLARQARIQGTVVLQAVIGKDGSVQDLRVVSGHPMLVQAAVNAVKQWLYKPYYLNGEAIEVETQVVVNFTLSGG
jgi:protein TonB